MNKDIPLFQNQPYQKYSPNVFDDSLTLYEQIISFIEYLNQVIASSNELNENMVNLKKEFEVFKSMIENDLLPASLTITLQEWFDNGKLELIINQALFKEKSVTVTNVTALKARNSLLGEQVSTIGYYSIYDGGKADYLIVADGVDDGGSFIKLNNGLYAKLNHNGTIYSKQYGVKSNNVDEDSVAMNKFLKMFGKAKLYVEPGISRITQPIFFEGLWNPSTNNGAKKIVFENHTFNYQGAVDGVSIYLFNHQKSFIDGLSVLKTSVLNYVNIAAFWYSELTNFELPKICYNKDNALIYSSLKIASSYTSTFSHGVTFLDWEFYGVGTQYGSFINSILFQDVKMQGNQIPTAEYNLKFYGTSFQNFEFHACDLSYSAKAIIYIDVAQARTMRLNFYSTYLDSKLPIIDKYNFKGATINTYTDQHASSQFIYVKTKNFLSSVSQGNYGLEASSPKSGSMNLARNGDLLYRKLSGWVYRGTSGALGNPEYSFVSNEHQINGWTLRVPFVEATQYVGFNSLLAPMEGMYNVAIRMKKVTGSGKLQVSFNPTAPIYDISMIDNDEELILTATTYKLQGDLLGVVLRATEVTANIVLDIYEISVTPTENMSINATMHPKAIEYPNATTTVNRPEPHKIMQAHFDLTLNKVIFAKTVNPIVWIDSNGITV